MKDFAVDVKHLKSSTLGSMALHLYRSLLKAYGSYCVGRIVTQSTSYFLYPCDCSVPCCAFLEAMNWVVAGKHLNASHPRSSVWPNPNVTIFLGNYF